MKVAFLLIGQPRTFNKTYKSIYENIIKPNNATVFMYSESLDTAQFEDTILTKFPEDTSIGSYVSMTHTRTKEFISLFNYLVQIKPSLTQENIAKAKLRPGYLVGSGTILQFFQLAKCYDLMVKYEKEHNMQFDVVIKSRFDVTITEPLNLINFFTKVDEEMLNEYGGDIYRRSLGSKKMAMNMKKEKTIKDIYNQDHYDIDKDYDTSTILEDINTQKLVWNIPIDQFHVCKRHVMPYLGDFVYHYGDYTPDKKVNFNAETQFTEHLKYHNIKAFGYFGKVDSIYFSHKSLNLECIDSNGNLNPDNEEELFWILSRLPIRSFPNP